MIRNPNLYWDNFRSLCSTFLVIVYHIFYSVPFSVSTTIIITEEHSSLSDHYSVHISCFNLLIKVDIVSIHFVVIPPESSFMCLIPDTDSDDVCGCSLMGSSIAHLR